MGQSKTEQAFLLIQLRDAERSRHLDKLSGLKKMVQAAQYKAEDEKADEQKWRLAFIQKGAQNRIQRRREQVAAQERKIEINTVRNLIGQLNHATASARHTISRTQSERQHMTSVAHQQRLNHAANIGTNARVKDLGRGPG